MYQNVLMVCTHRVSDWHWGSSHPTLSSAN